MLKSILYIFIIYLLYIVKSQQVIVIYRRIYLRLLDLNIYYLLFINDQLRLTSTYKLLLSFINLLPSCYKNWNAYLSDKLFLLKTKQWIIAHSYIILSSIVYNVDDDGWIDIIFIKAFKCLEFFTMPVTYLFYEVDENFYKS